MTSSPVKPSRQNTLHWDKYVRVHVEFTRDRICCEIEILAEQLKGAQDGSPPLQVWSAKQIPV